MEQISPRNPQISSERNTAGSRFNHDNIFGHEVLAYSNLGEGEKIELWLAEKGHEFKGEIGQVKRYVIGIPVKLEQLILTEGVDPNKRGVSLAKSLWDKYRKSREGTGIYTSTNPWSTMARYGPSGVVVDIATGNEKGPHNNLGLNILDKLKRPIEAIPMIGALATAASDYTPDRWYYIYTYTAFAVYLIARTELFNSIHRAINADTIRINPPIVPTFTCSLASAFRERNYRIITSRTDNHWLLVRDPDRVKAVGILHSPDESYDYLAHNQPPGFTR